jgi:hypothetical protein
MVRRARRFSRAQRSRQSAEPLGEQPGYAPATVATEIAALLVAADLAERGIQHNRGSVSAEDRRCMERQHRAMVVRAEH